MLLEEAVNLVVKNVLHLLIKGRDSFKHIFLQGCNLLRLPGLSFFNDFERFVQEEALQFDKWTDIVLIS